MDYINNGLMRSFQKSICSFLIILSFLLGCQTVVRIEGDVPRVVLSDWALSVGNIAVADSSESFFSSGGLAVVQRPTLDRSPSEIVEQAVVSLIEGNGGVVGVAGSPNLYLEIKEFSLAWASPSLGIQSDAVVEIAVILQWRSGRYHHFVVKGEDTISRSVVVHVSTAHEQVQNALNIALVELLLTVVEEVA